MKLREKEKGGSADTEDTQRLVTEKLKNSSHCITFSESKNKQNRFSIKHYENVRDVVSKNNSNPLNYNYRAKSFTKCQSATTKVNE